MLKFVVLLFFCLQTTLATLEFHSENVAKIINATKFITIVTESQDNIDNYLENVARLFPGNIKSNRIFTKKFHWLGIKTNRVKLTSLLIDFEDPNQLNDTKIVMFLKSFQNVLVIIKDAKPNLKDFLKFLWEQFRLINIFILTPHQMDFYDPFNIHNTDPSKMFESRRKKDYQHVTLRLEQFPSTYSMPNNWTDWTKGFKGPDIDISRLVYQSIGFRGEHEEYER